MLPLGAITLDNSASINLLGYSVSEIPWSPKKPGIVVNLSGVQMWNLKLKWVWGLKMNMGK